MIKDQNARLGTVKLPKENIDTTLNINQSKIQSNENKHKINKWDLINLKTFHSKGNHKKNGKTTYRMRKIFADEETKKGLTSKICKQFMQLNI